MFARQKIDGLGESALRIVFKFKLWFDKFISFANRGRLAAGAAAVATDKVKSDRPHRGIKQRAVLDLMVAPPELNESFLDNVFRVGRGLHPLAGK